MKTFPPLVAAPSARRVALHALLVCQRREAFVQEILHHYLSLTALSPADRRLTSQLVYGVLRRRDTLDALLRPLLAQPLGPGKEAVQEALRLGVFQLALLTQIPVHAAVHETVELVGDQTGNARLRGLANGVLRNVARMLTDEFASGPGADALPLEDGRYRRLAKGVLPEPAVHPVEYLAGAFALPAWLLRRWLARCGWDECLRLGFWFAATPPLWLRCNALKIERSALLAALAAAGVEAAAGTHPQAIRLAGHVNIRELPGFGAGWFAVQDASAMTVASALSPEPGSLVLDLCAAPGGKTTHLAELMGNRGRIVACDVDETRLQTLRELAQRLGATCIETHCLKGEGNLPAGPFDAILVDAPCSNTGVLGRRPEIRWRLRERDITALVNLQTRLLESAAERLKPGGKLVYSTCSIEPEENRQVVVSALQALTLEAEAESRPGSPADGGFWAQLRRK